MRDIKTKKSISSRVSSGSIRITAIAKKGIERSEDKIRDLLDDGQVTPEEYAQDKIKYTSEEISHNAAHLSNDSIKKTHEVSKRLVRFIKQKNRDDTIRQMPQSAERQTSKVITRDLRSSGQSATKSIKTTERSAYGTIKTAERTARTAGETLKASEKAAKASAQAAKRSAQTAKKAAEVTTKAAEAIAKATAAAIKSIAAAIQKLAAEIASGGWIVLVVLCLILIVGLIVGACFGLFNRT